MTMTPAEFAEQMKTVRENRRLDAEVAHAEMDDLMAKLLVELGYQEGVAIFEEQAKWYA